VQGPLHEVAPPARQRRKRRTMSEAERSTVSVKLRLETQDALALRVAARMNARTISAHVARLVNVSGNPQSAHREEDPFGDAASLTATMGQLPHEIRRLRSDLASKGGLVKSLFIQPESKARANRHAMECSRALAVMVSAAEETSVVLGRVEAELGELRVQLAEVIRGLVRP